MMSPDESILHGSWQLISWHLESYIYAIKIYTIKASSLIRLAHDQWSCGALACATSLFTPYSIVSKDKNCVHIYLNLCLTNRIEYCGGGHCLFMASKSKGCPLYHILFITNFRTPDCLHSLDSCLHSFTALTQDQ